MRRAGQGTEAMKEVLYGFNTCDANIGSLCKATGLSPSGSGNLPTHSEHKSTLLQYMKLTLEETSLLIQLLEDRRIYFESRNKVVASQASALIAKLSKNFYTWNKSKNTFQYLFRTFNPF